MKEKFRPKNMMSNLSSKRLKHFIINCWSTLGTLTQMCYFQKWMI